MNETTRNERPSAIATEITHVPTSRLSASERFSLSTIDEDAECVVLFTSSDSVETINRVADREILLASF